MKWIIALVSLASGLSAGLQNQMWQQQQINIASGINVAKRTETAISKRTFSATSTATPGKAATETPTPTVFVTAKP